MKTRILAVTLALVMMAPVPFVGATETGPGTHFGNGNIPEGCSSSLNDGCYHMRTNLNHLDTPIIDVLLVPPASPYPERDLRVMRQAIEMWDAGIHFLARDMGLDWLADTVEFNIFLDDDEFTTHPAWDPEIIVVATNPVGGAGIGIDPFGVRGPCKGANPLAGFDVWEDLPGFDSHHDGHSGTYEEECEGGGTTCYAVNGAIDPLPGSVDIFGMFDLVAHEVGHCLSVGHVGDALDHTTAAVPFADIMAYADLSHDKCVSTLDVEGFAIRMSQFLLPSDQRLTANSAPFQVQHPSDHYYASSTGEAADCPQPDAGLTPGEPTDFNPGDDEEGGPAVVIEDPADGAGVAAALLTVSGTVDRQGGDGSELTASVLGPQTVTAGQSARYTVSASGGQSADGFTCTITADAGASVDEVAGTDGCAADITWPAEATATVTGEADDGAATDTDQLPVTVTAPDGIPSPNGEITGGITIFPNGVPLAYNELVAFVTGEAGDPAPKFLPGTAVELNTRFTTDSTGVAAPANSGISGTTGKSFTWHVWSSDQQLVATVPCVSTQDGSATTPVDGINCQAPFVMPDEIGRYFTTLQFEEDGRWVCHDTGALLFGLVPAEGIPDCIKAFDVVVRDDVAPTSSHLAPEDVPAAFILEMLGAGSDDPQGDALVPLTSMDIVRVELVAEDADTITFELEVDDMSDLPPSVDLFGLGGVSFKHGLRFCTTGGDASTAYPGTFGTDATGECYTVELTRGVLGDTVTFGVIAEDSSGCGLTAPAGLSATVDGDVVTFAVPRGALTLASAPASLSACGAGGTSMTGTALADGENLVYLLGQTRASGGLFVTLNPTLDDAGGIVSPPHEFGTGGDPLAVTASVPGAVETGADATVSAVVTGGTEPYTCQWAASGPGAATFGDDASCTSTTVSFDTAGVYDVTIDVDDAAGASASDGGDVTVTDDPPAGERVELFVDGVRHDTQPVDTSDASTDTWSGKVDLTGLSGEHTITAEWYDTDDALLDADSVTVTVETANEAPTADLSADPETVQEGEDVTFTLSASDGDGTIASWSLDFGDETSPAGGSGTPPATVTHAYTTAGAYTATLTVVDDDGADGSDTASVTVEDGPNAAPTADIDGPARAPAGSEVTFDGSGSNDADGTIVEWRWDMGDGTILFGETVTHSYSTPGKMDIELTVTDDDGATGQATFRHAVQGPPS